MPVPSEPPAVTAGTTTDHPSPLEVARAGVSVIATAKQLLTERHGIDADEAFELLRLYGRRSDLPIRDVALRLVSGRWLPVDHG